MAGAADLPAAVLASNELLVTLDATERATNFTLTEDGLHLVSVDTSACCANSALPARQQEERADAFRSLDSISCTLVDECPSVPGFALAHNTKGL